MIRGKPSDEGIIEEKRNEAKSLSKELIGSLSFQKGQRKVNLRSIKRFGCFRHREAGV
jgi:hypothetical protein